MGKADAQNFGLVGDPQIPDRIIDVAIADPVADDPPGAVSLDEIVGGCFRQVSGRFPVFEQLDVQVARYGRHGDVVEGVFAEIAGCLAGCDLPQGDDAGGVVDSRGGAQNDRFLELFGKVEGVSHHVLGLCHRGGFQNRKPGQLAVIAVVLLVLAGKHEGVVRGEDHQPGPYPHVGQGHQGVGGDVDAHVLHDAHGAHAGVGRCRRDFQGDLFIGAVFEVEVAFLGDVEKIERNLGRGGAGIGGADGDTCLDRPPGDGFIA